MTDLEQAEKNLDDYIATLSPEKQQWANDLRAELDALPNIDDRLKLILKKIGECFGRLGQEFPVEHVAR